MNSHVLGGFSVPEKMTDILGEKGNLSLYNLFLLPLGQRKVILPLRHQVSETVIVYLAVYN